MGVLKFTTTTCTYNVISVPLSSCVDCTAHSSLSYPCRNGHLDIVKYLVEDKHCDVRVTNDNGWTPLHYSCL